MSEDKTVRDKITDLLTSKNYYNLNSKVLIDDLELLFLREIVNKERLKNKELQRQNEIMKKALLIYAEPLYWRSNSGKVGITFLTNGQDSELINDQITGGKAARHALAECEPKENV